MLSFSVVINTFNRAKSLACTLASLRQLDYPLFEVIVVNGPSTDRTDAVLSQYEGQVKILSCAERNLAISRNLGIAAAAGQIVAFIDDDAYPDPAWLDCLSVAFKDDEVAAAGGPTYDYTGYKLQAKYSLATRTGGAWVSAADDRNPTDLLDRPYSNVFPYTIGTNSCFRRARLVEIGGFDEEFEYYLDETDLCLRLIDRGYLVRALDDGFVYHKFLESHMRTHTRSLRDRFSVLKNRVYFALKHGRVTTSFYHVCCDLVAFIDQQRKDFLWNVEHGFLTKAEYTAFEADIPRAFDVGFSRIVEGGERTRSATWFAERETPFLPFRTLRPAAEKLHLCLLSQEYPPGVINGIARFTHEMARGLAERGHQVHVLTAGQHHHRVDLEDGVWVHRIVPEHHPLPAAPVVPQDRWNYSASLCEEVLRIHRHRPLDLVQAPIWDSEGIATLLADAVPVVISLHTPLPVALEISPHWAADRNALQTRIRPLIALERFCLENCSAILANSNAIVGEIERVHVIQLEPDKVHVIPHGFGAVPRPIYSPERDAGGPNVLFVGRLERRKGIDIFLEAVALLADRFPSMTFTVVGDDRIPSSEGPTYRELFQRRPDHAQLQSRTHFTGRVDDEQLARFYADCDIFVAPSRYESFGLILIEAMANGKPVIACDVGGMREIVVEGENGFLVPPGNSEKLADAIGRLAQSPALREHMALRSRELYETRFTRSVMAERTERFCALLAARIKGDATECEPGGLAA